MLINRILDEEASRCGLRLGLGASALECLLGYSWPGNVRQLRHVLRYACAICPGESILLEDLPEDLHGIVRHETTETPASPERQALLDALVRRPGLHPKRWGSLGQPCTGG